MNLIPKISEFDLYLYVFHPLQLGDEKKEYIAGNEYHTEAIDLLKELALTAQNSVTQVEKELLRGKIGVYQPNDNIIYLYPGQELSEAKKQPKVLYRAASIEIDESITSKTFFDKNKQYMVKANINHRSTKIYIFTNSGETLHNITLNIHPGNTSHHLTDNLEPLVLEGRVEVDHISLEVGES